MDTQSMHAFVEVAKTASFSHAAEALHLTQPAISKRIARLEEQLDTRLFDRIGRHVHLTEAGEAFLPRCQRILSDIQDAERLIHGLDGRIEGSLSMGISHHIGLHRLPPVLRRFTQQHPSVRLDIDFMDSEQAHQRILQGELDLAVITLAPTKEHRLEAFEVWRDSLALAVSHEHPLLDRPADRPVTLKELSAYTAIPPGLGTYTGQIIKQRFDAEGLTMDIGMSTNYLETIKVMVSIGLGWSLLPLTLHDDTITHLPMAGPPWFRELGCVHHRDRSLSNAARAFIEELKIEASRQTERPLLT